MTSLPVVVLSWNRADETVACVDRLLAWRRLRPEIWVVDNASRDDSVEKISLRREVRLLASPVNLGFGGGNNLALGRIEGEFALLLNSDATLAEEAAISLIEALRARPGIAVIGPLLRSAGITGTVVSAGGRDISRHIGTHVTLERSEARGGGGEEVREVDYVPGTVALLRTEDLARVGGLDQEYFFSGEMADLCERLRLQGRASAVLTSVTADHAMEQAGGHRPTLYAYYSLRNRFLFIRKLRRRLLLPLSGFWISYALFFTARAALTGRWPVARVGALALADGLRGRFGGQNDRVLGGRG